MISFSFIIIHSVSISVEDQGSMHENNEINENDTDQEVEENELVETELEETKGISEIEEENTTEPERNTANSAPECPEPVSVNREISLPSLNQENRGIANKSGFFASRSLKKALQYKCQ